MKILHVHDHLEFCGGAETYLLNVVQELEKAGHEQSFAYADGNPDLAPRSHHVPSLVSAVRTGSRESGEAIKRIAKKERPDIIHFHNIYDTGAFEGAFQSAPTMFTSHGFGHLCPATSFYFRRTREICQRSCGPMCFPTTALKHCLSPRPRTAMAYYRRVKWFHKQRNRYAHVVGPSQSVVDRYVKAGYPADRVSSVPYFCPIDVAVEPARAPEKPTVLFIGRLVDIKGADFFVQAVAKLPKDVQATMIGNFDEARTRQFDQLARSAGCREQITFLPWVDRDGIREVYEKTTLLVFPSICPETLGIVGLEAMANGVPVVAADVGGVREWLLPDKTGVLVPPKDPQALADGIKRILDSPEIRKEYGLNGMQLIREKFSVSTHLNKLVGIYQSILE
ncbi:MAG: glycosyltransferase family 4 protein [Limisphaerales bacterium]